MLTVAIVGRPNVGKSSLFNRLVGRRVAIVDETSGVTRDRLYTTVDWFGSRFQLIDTGGLVSDPDELEVTIEQQAQLALQEADLLLFTVDGQDGRMALDDFLVEKLRKTSKPVWIVVNKLDNDTMQTSWTEFSGYGLEPIFPISSLHKRGLDVLLDAICEFAASFSSDEQDAVPSTAIAIVGRPNAGKSSLVNALTGSQRSIVSDVPGTTRDSVDVALQWPVTRGDHTETRDIVLIDTAGIKRRRTVNTKLDAYSISRSEAAIRRSSVAILLLDASTGITATDKKIANLISDAGKGCVIGINKWDLIQGKYDQNSFSQWAYQELAFLSYAPLVFISALSGTNIDALINKACDVDLIASETITTGVLNRVMTQAFEGHSPPLINGKRLKYYYTTQTGTSPPRFLVFVNDPKRVSLTYTSYLIGKLRDAFGFEGSPIVLKWRARSHST